MALTMMMAICCRLRVTYGRKRPVGEARDPALRRRGFDVVPVDVVEIGEGGGRRLDHLHVLPQHEDLGRLAPCEGIAGTEGAVLEAGDDACGGHELDAVVGRDTLAHVGEARGVGERRGERNGQEEHQRQGRQQTNDQDRPARRGPEGSPAEYGPAEGGYEPASPCSRRSSLAMTVIACARLVFSTGRKHSWASPHMRP